MSRRSTPVLAVAAVLLLGACTNSAPPAKELAEEVVDSMVARGEVTEAVGECMIEEINDFSLTEEQATGFSDFDDVANKAAEGNELALQIMGDFQNALAACN